MSVSACAPIVNAKEPFGVAGSAELPSSLAQVLAWSNVVIAVSSSAVGSALMEPANGAATGSAAPEPEATPGMASGAVCMELVVEQM